MAKGKPLTIQEVIHRGASHRTMRLTMEDLLQLKVGVWDVEASDLKGDAGVLLCGSVKTIGKRGLRMYRIDDDHHYRKHPWKDGHVAEHLRNDLEQHDVIVHHYGDRYDVPFTNTRLIVAKKRILDSSKMCFIDTWLNIRHRLKLHNNRLASLIDLLNTKVHKTALNLEIWTMASMGHKPSLDLVVEHNRADVFALEEVVLDLIHYYPLRYTYLK